MASTRKQLICCLLGLIFVVLVAVGCSDGSSAPPDNPTPTASSSADAASGSETTDAAGGEPTPAATPSSILTTEGHASVTDLAAGEQVEDVQGNLIAIYGFAEWPASFDDLTDDAQTLFPFFGDVSVASDPSVALVVLDIGMCSAGIDGRGFGTADFFVHSSPDDVLSTGSVLDRGVLARHPVVQPGFGFPAVAECARGYLPVAWGGTNAPTTARYVVATRAASDSDIERHVYQWDIDEVFIDESDSERIGADPFLAGQTVTFNEGRLADTSVVVDGWAERVGAASEIEGTRVVSVSLSLCPATPLLPEFGLSVDGWNVVAPLPSDVLAAASSSAPSLDCFDGWLDFAVPFGGVPTGFFASDGANAIVGYAEWSLDNAALPAPQ